MPERDERALRDALAGLAPEDEPDPVAARRGARRRHAITAVAGTIAALVVVLAGVLMVPRLLGGASQVAGPAPVAVPTTGPAPDGWRTEYYRDISFEVPEDWGYAFEPASDWCADSASGRPLPEHRQPYVSLGQRAVVRSIQCPEPPTSLLTEHVSVVPHPSAAEPIDTTMQRGRWWIVQRVWPSVVLRVASDDRGLATRIAESAAPADADAPCAPTSPVQGGFGARPEPPSDLGVIGPVDRAVICQYDVDASSPGDGGLRAVRTVDGSAAEDLLTSLAAAPSHTDACQPNRQASEPQIALVVRFLTGDRRSDIYVQAAGCPTGGAVGGILDGTSDRELTRDACQMLVAPPIMLQSASGAVARACMP